MTIAKRLPVSLKIFHGLGSIAYGVKDNGFSVFLLIFYNQVLGLDAGLVGTAIMVALIIDAFADPVIGELGDRTQTRWGRRLPWLYTAAIPLGFAWYALWHPPQADPAVTIIWLVGFSILVRSLVAACEVPSIALVPELTADYHERTSLMRFRFLFGWAGGLLIMIISYAFIFRGADAVTRPDGYNSYAILGSVMMAGTVLISALAQHKYVAQPSPPRPANSGRLRDALFEMRETLSNGPFIKLISATLFAFISQAITFAMTNYLMIYVWRLDQNGLAIYGISLFFSVIIAFLLVGPISARKGKKGGAILTTLTSLAIFILLYAAWFTRIFPGAPDAPIKWLMFLVFNLSNAFAICTMILNSSMMADVVEASQFETGRRSEGLFFAGYFFMQKCAVGIGIFLTGVILSMAQFPQNATGGNVALPILDNMVIYYVVGISLLSISYAILLQRFPIGQEDHDARLAILAGRTAGSQSATKE